MLCFCLLSPKWLFSLFSFFPYALAEQGLLGGGLCFFLLFLLSSCFKIQNCIKWPFTSCLVVFAKPCTKQVVLCTFVCKLARQNLFSFFPIFLGRPKLIKSMCILYFIILFDYKYIYVYIYTYTYTYIYIYHMSNVSSSFLLWPRFKVEKGVFVPYFICFLV